ncbi:MAG: hypothetical protein A3F72_17595 [Bacteroidetes bacterium RIFCSPLOWO2_12_FULL_35_15]|nr:MAG: hypothetical protein A3F72_17595 [Bacteroidetes bacterium RIFCSPLOWO2_12_FULL_35_15]
MLIYLLMLIKARKIRNFWIFWRGEGFGKGSPFLKRTKPLEITEKNQFCNFIRDESKISICDLN